MRKTIPVTNFTKQLEGWQECGGIYMCEARGYSYMLVVTLDPTILTVRSMKSTFRLGSVNAQRRPPLIPAFLKALYYCKSVIRSLLRFKIAKQLSTNLQ